MSRQPGNCGKSRSPLEGGASQAAHVRLRSTSGAGSGHSRGRASSAFSLIEVLVVMGIIAVLAGIGIPALKGLGAGNDVAAANRQLLDDLAYARMKAINDRTTVYVVFVSDRIWRQPLNSQHKREVAKMANLQFTSYALFAKRTLGDQPGASTPRYITEWRSLPEGIFIPTNKFTWFPAGQEGARMAAPLAIRPFSYEFVPFPYATNQPVELPCITFDYLGRLKQPGDIVIPISRGTVIYPQEQNPNSTEPPEVLETPRGNYTNNPVVRIDWLTGRARLEQPEKVNYAAAHY